jgi:hypothetical protein
MPNREIRVTKIGPSPDNSDYVSFQVSFFEKGNRLFAVEARLSAGTLEVVQNPEERIRKWFDAKASLPKANEVIVVPGDEL